MIFVIYCYTITHAHQEVGSVGEKVLVSDNIKFVKNNIKEFILKSSKAEKYIVPKEVCVRLHCIKYAKDRFKTIKIFEVDLNSSKAPIKNDVMKACKEIIKKISSFQKSNQKFDNIHFNVFAECGLDTYESVIITKNRVDKIKEDPDLHVSSHKVKMNAITRI